MSYRVALIVAWLLATVASVAVAFAGVSSVRTAVAGPGSLNIEAAASGETTTTTSFIETPPTEVEAVGSGSIPQVVGTTEVPSSTTSSDDEGSGEGGSTGATAPSVTTTTTAPSQTTQGDDDDTSFETYETEGGWVTVRSDKEGVYLETASSRSGFTVEVEDDGPQEVVVVFKRPGEEIHFKATFDDGRVRIKIED